MTIYGLKCQISFRRSFPHFIEWYACVDYDYTGPNTAFARRSLDVRASPAVSTRAKSMRFCSKIKLAKTQQIS